MSQAVKSYAPAKCAWCSGTGKWQVAPGNIASCIVCGGKGQVSVTQPTSHCEQCEGRGRGNTISPCLTCAGTGWSTYLSSNSRSQK
ncbi:MAG: transcriptional regulator [Actinomycetota bacterium]